MPPVLRNALHTPPVHRRRAMVGALVAGLSSSLGSRDAAANAAPTLSIGYLHWQRSVDTISLVFQPAPDNGRAGAEVGVADNNTTGRFLQQNFALQTVEVSTGQDPVPALHGLLAKGIRLVVTDLPAAAVLRIAEAGASAGVVVFNAEAPDDALREQQCRENLIHTAPSNAMLADALAQYLIWKRWSRWFLAYGMQPDDLLLADAYRNAAKVFGARIVADRQYKGQAGSRETDSGLIELQQQLPVFTQNAPDYDVLVCADQHAVFAGYLPYRTWDARLVAGSAGLMPTSWDPNSTEFGGKQMQDRFQAYAHRLMTATDMNAWVAVRMIGTAASYVQSLDVDKVMAYMRSDQFQLGAYRGLSLSIRSWNGQVRQAILLSDSGRTVVSMSPQPGFLHQYTVLDTLGTDRSESVCKFPAAGKT
jgi:ABC transporter substrate binding protein (PQQ-dependent alcohol dehydrogenase system)